MHCWERAAASAKNGRAPAGTGGEQPAKASAGGREFGGADLDCTPSPRLRQFLVSTGALTVQLPSPAQAPTACLPATTVQISVLPLKQVQLQPTGEFAYARGSPNSIMMWLLKFFLVLIGYFMTVDASTTVIPRPPFEFIKSPSFDVTTPSMQVVRSLDMTAATPSHQARQIPPPPAPKYFGTTPGYQIVPPHFRLLWAEQEDNIPQNTPKPLMHPTKPFHV
ncbi:Hypothetical predicted protein [Cloeon dipterum]|uniref:Uncharacterized protein n=1 Tax=Cloeon dipterum TaxID=197152 RepID=A0A8S1CCB2_9INSE|nr:Hypothetical predicted protein [Cloeon dipterum]